MIISCSVQARWKCHSSATPLQSVLSWEAIVLHIRWGGEYALRRQLRTGLGFFISFIVFSIFRIRCYSCFAQAHRYFINLYTDCFTQGTLSITFALFCHCIWLYFIDYNSSSDAFFTFYFWNLPKISNIECCTLRPSGIELKHGETRLDTGNYFPKIRSKDGWKVTHVLVHGWRLTAHWLCGPMISGWHFSSVLSLDLLHMYDFEF